MKRYFSAFLILGTLSALAGQRLPEFVIAIRQDLYEAKHDKVAVVLTELWDGAGVKPYDSGWSCWCQTNNTNQVWMLYVVTDSQTHNRATPERIQAWKDRIADVNRLRMVKVPDGDWQAVAREYGLKPMNETTNGIPR